MCATAANTALASAAATTQTVSGGSKAANAKVPVNQLVSANKWQLGARLVVAVVVQA